MLIQFSVNNFRSIKDNVTLSMLAASKDISNTFFLRDGSYELLNSAVLYGANASGKSNILKAMAQMRNIVLNSTKVHQSTDKLPHNPYKLTKQTVQASTSFEIIFFVQENKYRYGFEFDSTTVYAEWLFLDENGREAKLFYRDIEEEFYVNKNKFKEGRGLEEKTLKNQLFIWKCDAENGPISKEILQWFSHFNMIDGLENRGYIDFTINQMKNQEFKKEIVSLVKFADLGIIDIATNESKIDSKEIEAIPLPREIKDQILNDENLIKIETHTSHKFFDQDNNEVGQVRFDLHKDESFGTNKFFAMSAPILDTLKRGGILIVDELDASLHPILTTYLIRLFHNKKVNSQNAQLIFATHDTNLLNADLLRRDQIWFTEKDKYGSTDLYSLVEYKINKARKSTNLEKNYLQGRYGAIPYIGEFGFGDA